MSLYGQHNKIDNSYLINRSEGFFVVEPDNLISGTSVVAASYCRRKGILMYNFKGLDPEFSKYVSNLYIVPTYMHYILKSINYHR